MKHKTEQIVRRYLRAFWSGLNGDLTKSNLKVLIFRKAWRGVYCLVHRDLYGLVKSRLVEKRFESRVATGKGEAVA